MHMNSVYKFCPHVDICSPVGRMLSTSKSQDSDVGMRVAHHHSSKCSLVYLDDFNMRWPMREEAAGKSAVISFHIFTVPRLERTIVFFIGQYQGELLQHVCRFVIPVRRENTREIPAVLRCHKWHEILCAPGSGSHAAKVGAPLANPNTTIVMTPRICAWALAPSIITPAFGKLPWASAASGEGTRSHGENNQH